MARSKGKATKKAGYTKVTIGESLDTKKKSSKSSSSYLLLAVGIIIIVVVVVWSYYENGNSNKTQDVLQSSISSSSTNIVEESTCINTNEENEDPTCTEQQINLGQYNTWEEAPVSTKEFDHDNNKKVCRLPIISVDEWESGRYWEKEEPCIVKNVTDGWLALDHWTKAELLRRYPDVKVGMGRTRDLGQTGPDDAGDKLTKTTIKDFVINHMHDPKSEKYVFDRKLNMPDGLVDDCQPYPMPTRMYADYGDALKGLGGPERILWKDHLALTIGRDQQGLTFHRHNAAWNVVVFGSKRWILYDPARMGSDKSRWKRMTRDVNRPIQLTTPDWIRKLYNKDDRKYEIRNFGHDCVQRPGELLFVPKGWGHMVINIGDTVAVVSERGLDAMES